MTRSTQRRAIATVTIVAMVVLRVSTARADPPPFAWTSVPASLRLGIDPPARVEFTGPDFPLERIEVVATAGAVRDLTRVGPGHFTARFEAPALHAPDVAVLLVRARGSAIAAAASIPLAGRYHITLTVEPHARVEVFVATGQVHRATVPASGRLDMLLVVPPGVEQAHIAATDRNGNTTDTASILELPPVHRVLLVAARPPDDEPRALRWIMAAATPTGTLATEPPVTTVAGAVGEIRPLAPGLFYVIAHAPRAVTPQTVTVRVEVPGTAVTPGAIEATVPAVAPARIEITAPAPIRVAERMSLTVTVRDDEGLPVRGLARMLSVQLSSSAETHVEARGDTYEVTAVAPDRAGALTASAQLVAPDLPNLHATLALRVAPGPAVRVDAQSGILVVGQTGVVELRGLDRFGNVAPIGNPAVQGTNARVIAIEPREYALRVQLVPAATSGQLAVRGDYGLSDHVDLSAHTAPLHPFSVGLAGTLRHNLGALAIAGGLVVFGVDLPLGGRFHALGTVSAGVEGAAVTTPQNSSISLVAIPVFAHIGLTVRFGRFDFGPMIGAGAWAVFASEHTYDNDSLQQRLGVVGFSAAIVARVQTPVGRFWIQTGGVTGSLDTVPVDGTLGGIYGQLGWSAGL